MAITGNQKEYRDGDKIKCQQCGKDARVKWFPDKQSAIVPPGEREELVLRCQACGFISCNACAHPGDSMFPVCPQCQKEWGPYYFIGGPATPASSITADSETTINRPAKADSWEQAMRMELPQTGEMLDENTLGGTKRSGGLRGSPVLLLVFLLIGILAAGLVFVLLRMPAITAALAGMRPEATATSMALRGTELAATPALVHDQSVVVEGIIQPPTNTDGCEKSKDGVEWCQTSIQVYDTQTQVWVQLGSPVNGVTSNFQFLDNDGSLITFGSTIRAEGVANCDESTACQIRVQKIEVLIKATITPTPTQEIPKTATLKPTATRYATPTLAPTATPTESGCANALSVTLESLKEELCVQGTVSEVFVQEQAVLLLFDNQATSFIFVSYGPPLDFEAGDCVIGNGKIQQLGKRPVIVVTYKNLVEKCP
jgi:hypothetical protein